MRNYSTSYFLIRWANFVDRDYTALPVAVNKSYLTLITLQRDNPNFNGIVGTLQPIYFPSRKIVVAPNNVLCNDYGERAATAYRPIV